MSDQNQTAKRGPKPGTKRTPNAAQLWNRASKVLAEYTDEYRASLPERIERTQARLTELQNALKNFDAIRAQAEKDLASARTALMGQ